MEYWKVKYYDSRDMFYTTSPKKRKKNRLSKYGKMLNCYMEGIDISGLIIISPVIYICSLKNKM